MREKEGVKLIREFKLQNENGQNFSMMDIENYCLLTEPSGLGISYITEYEQIEETFSTNSRKIEQVPILGTVNCLKYKNFKNLVDFIESSSKLKFIYKVPFEDSAVEYYRDVQFQSLTKSEKQTTGAISEEITFNPLSLWYEKTETILQIENSDNERRWNFKHNARYMSYNNRTIIFNNKGHVKAPFQIEIDGYVENPSISIYVNNEIYASIKIKIEIQEYEKFLYSSKNGDIYIQKQNSDGTKENLFTTEYVDITNQNIFKLPLGTSEIKLSAKDDIASAKVSIFPQFKVV